MMTIEEFDKLPLDEIFATGVLPNSEEGLFMTRGGGNLRWVAKKGWGHDWAIYCHWENKSVEWIKESGDKVTSPVNIQKCVPCDAEVFNLYRY